MPKPKDRQVIRHIQYKEISVKKKDLTTGKERTNGEVPSPSNSQADINLQISMRIAQLEKGETKGRTVRELVEKSNKLEIKGALRELNMENKKAIGEQQKSSSKQVQKEPAQPAYEPNRAPKQAHKKVTKDKEEQEVTLPVQPPIPEVPGPLETAPELLQSASVIPEPLVAASESWEPLQAAPATPEPEPAALESLELPPTAPDTPEPPIPKVDPKAAQLAKALEELRSTKVKIKTLKTQNQKYEGMEKKLEKMKEEKRELKESHALEMRGVNKEHSDLVKYQQDTIGNLKKDMVELSQQNKKLSQENEELQCNKEKDVQKIQELESALAIMKQKKRMENEIERMVTELCKIVD